MQPNGFDDPAAAQPGQLPEVVPLREASRQVVRELGMLEDTYAPAQVTHSQVHALLELSRRGVATVGELADALRLDKSVVSRVTAKLIERRLVRTSPTGDRRAKPLTLAAAGRRLVARIHREAGATVDEALRQLTEDERALVVRGMSLYAEALRRARAGRTIAIRPITVADDPELARIIRDVMTEHGASGPGFAIHDPEVAAMSATYGAAGANPASAYFVLEGPDGVIGGAGFGPLAGGEPGVCELRKMYLRPSARGLGLGRRLLRHVLGAAKDAGYARCYLETMATMHRARALYESEGFAPLCGPAGATGHFGCDSWYARPL